MKIADMMFDGSLRPPLTAHKSNALSALSTAKNSGTGWFLRLDHSIVGISLNEFLAGEDIEVTNVEKKSEDTLIQTLFKEDYCCTSYCCGSMCYCFWNHGM